MSTDFPTASVGSSQAPTAAVEKSLSASHTKILTLPWLLLFIVVKTAIAASTTMSNIALQYPNQVINQQTPSAAAVSAG